MEEGRYVEAQQVYDEFMDPYEEITGAIRSATAGEGVRQAVVNANGPLKHRRPPNLPLRATCSWGEVAHQAHRHVPNFYPHLDWKGPWCCHRGVATT